MFLCSCKITADAFEILVKQPWDNQTWPVQVTGNTTVMQVKEKLEELVRCPKKKMKLIFHGTTVDDHATMRALEVTPLPSI